MSLFRDYKITDSEEIMNLLSQLGYPVENSDSITTRFNKILSDKSYFIKVLEDNNKIIGFCGYHKMYMIEDDQSYIRIISLVINENYRGKGYGSKFIEFVEQHALNLNCNILTLNSGLNENRISAHQFYLSKGFSIKSNGFIKKIK